MLQPGAPNLRAVPGTNVYGVGLPTVAGIRATLAHVGAAPSTTAPSGDEVSQCNTWHEALWLQCSSRQGGVCRCSLWLSNSSLAVRVVNVGIRSRQSGTICGRRCASTSTVGRTCCGRRSAPSRTCRWTPWQSCASSGSTITCAACDCAAYIPALASLVVLQCMQQCNLSRQHNDRDPAC